MQPKFSLRRLCGILGVLLLLAAAALAACNLYTDYSGGAAAQSVAQQLAQPEPASPRSEAANTAASGSVNTTTTWQREMPAAEIDGAQYIGTLEIPALGLTLPVASEWSTHQAKTSPCRYTGSAYDGTLTVAGHNYKSHFGRLSELSLGDEVRFTDVEGNVFVYTVTAFESIDMYDLEAMQAGEWDLTLFTCDSSRVRRVTVRCAEVSRIAA